MARHLVVQGTCLPSHRQYSWRHRGMAVAAATIAAVAAAGVCLTLLAQSGGVRGEFELVGVRKSQKLETILSDVKSIDSRCSIYRVLLQPHCLPSCKLHAVRSSIFHERNASD
jgi:chorismate synthase